MKQEKILIFGPSWVGDMVMAKSLFANLKKRNPDCEIHLASPEWSIGIAKRFIEIDKIIPLSFTHGKLNLYERIKLSIKLKKDSYTECIFLVNTFKSLFSIFFSKIKKRTGFVGELRSFALTNVHKNSNKPTINKYTQLAQSTKFIPKIIPPQLLANKQKAHEYLKKNKIPTKKIIVIAGGAEFGPAKILPTKKYAFIANQLINLGYNILLIGSRNDININAEINKQTNNKCFNVTGKTTLENSIDIIGICLYFLSNDSGLMHIAASLNVNQECFFGSSDPKNTPPLNKKANINYLNLDCSPCFKRECPLNHFNCMNEINEDKIAERIICHLKS